MKRSAMQRAVTVVALTAISTTACQSEDVAEPDPIDIGVLLPLSGQLEAAGTEARDALELYVDSNDGKLGGREVNLVFGDEGDSPESSLPAAQKLIKQDEVDVLTGTVSSANYVAVAPETTKHEVPLIGIGGQPNIEGMDLDVEWLWQTSFTSNDPGEAIAPYMAENIDGPVYAIGPEYEGGYQTLNAFTEPFIKEGGELANDEDEAEWTPWPTTEDYSSYFEDVANSDAEAIFAFYVGKPAVDFVTQYAKSPASDVPLYGIFLTEGPALAAQSEAAEDVHTVMNYSPTIDNAANRTFVSQWSNAHPDRQTSLFSMAGWDAALVLDQAVAAIDSKEEANSAAINDAINGLGTIESPRGPWRLTEDTHAPIQKWYLRTVTHDGPSLANVVIEDLATIGN